MDLKVPVLFLIFNRPAITQRVFDVLRQVRPSRLFVAADGPRDDRPKEAEICQQTRRIIDTVDWDCELTILYREKNLGCRKAVSSAIDWFFTNVEEGIILEDDCLPSQSFFGYCQELLKYYRYDTRVMQINGSNLLKKWDRNGCSYFFSSYGPVWGWASWRRAWKFYDADMKLWPEIRGKKLYGDFCLSYGEPEYRHEIYDKVYYGEIDTWDYQWGFAKMINSGLCITPKTNLIRNIGYGINSTHTSNETSFSNLEISEINMPLKHPEFTLRDKEFDIQYNKLYLPQKRKTVYQRILSRLTGE
jgi:hypothetical protein